MKTTRELINFLRKTANELETALNDGKIMNELEIHLRLSPGTVIYAKTNEGLLNFVYPKDFH